MHRRNLVKVPPSDGHSLRGCGQREIFGTLLLLGGFALRAFLGSKLLAVDGPIQREGDVKHLIAVKLFDYSAPLGRLETTSRDFHRIPPHERPIF